MHNGTHVDADLRGPGPAMNASDELEPLLTALRNLRRGRRRAALITITRTRGATFRRVGTRMLVYEDGSTVCELSGGCPQRDIVTRALDAIADETPRQVRYDADSGLDVLMEMGCSGELEVLIEPLADTGTQAYVAALSACLEQRREGRLVTVYADDGDTVPTRHALWCGDELRHDGIADVALLARLRTQAQAAPVSATRTVVTTARGRFTVLVERLLPPHALIVIGSSAAARALLPLATLLGWSTMLVDIDAAHLHAATLPAGIRALCATPAELVARACPDAATAVVVMTHNLQQDADYLAALRGVPLAFVGLLGSRRRVQHVLDLATTSGMDVHAPVGLDIGSESPAEIALSIVAEIVAVSRGHQGGSLRDLTGAIH